MNPLPCGFLFFSVISREHNFFATRQLELLSRDFDLLLCSIYQEKEPRQAIGYTVLQNQKNFLIHQLLRLELRIWIFLQIALAAGSNRSRSK